MKPKRLRGKNGILALAAVAAIALVLVAAFTLSQSGQHQEGIVLPSTTPLEPSPPAEETPPADDGFVQVTVDNVRDILAETIQTPDAYHLSYTVSVGADDAQTQRTVELWVNGSILLGEVSDDMRTKSVLSDGTTTYLWYNTDRDHLTLSLTGGTTAMDLLGLPSMDFLTEINNSTITDADFVALADSQVQCIYVCCQNDAIRTNRYWIDLQSGLIYQADVLEESRQVYAVQRVYFERLAQEDETFSGRFRLSDGTEPFADSE